MPRVKDHVQYFAKLRTFPSSFVMFVAATLFCSHIHEMVGRNLVLCLKRAENLIFLLERCGFNLGLPLQIGEKQRNVRACPVPTFHTERALKLFMVLFTVPSVPSHTKR